MPVKNGKKTGCPTMTERISKIIAGGLPQTPDTQHIQGKLIFVLMLLCRKKI
jgi:hypothetical protein